MIIRDGEWRLYDYDFPTRRSIWVIHDGNKMRFRIDYPVENLVRSNEAFRGEGQSGEWRRVASMPLNLYYGSGFAEAVVQDDRRFISRFLNDGNNRAWRTDESKI